MQNILPLIKDFKRVVQSFFLTLILALVSFNATAQSAAPQVSLTVNILPPYSPYYSDYAGVNASKVLLIVRNLTPTQKKIKLTGQLNGDNGIRITTKSNYVPLQPIILNPNETKQLNGLALKDIFDLNSLNVYGVDKVKLVQSSRLPEGNYSFCIQAVDMNTNQLISSSAPLGCTNISVAYPDAPVLVSPVANFPVSATIPQSVVFNWLNPGFVPMGTQYVLQIAEMPLRAADPNQVLNSVSFPLVNRTLNGLSYVVSPVDPPLIIGKTYAWRVKAVDPSGKVVFKNGGISQANLFTYVNPVKLDPVPILVSPQQQANIISTSNGPFFQWTNGSSPKNGYILQVVEMPGSGGNPEQIFSLNKFVINETVNGLSYTLPQTNPKLIVGKRYAWRVTTADQFAKGQSKLGAASTINTFSYNPKNEVEPPLLLSPIANAKITLISPQNIAFDWEFKTKGYFRYNFQVVELTTPASNPAQAFEKGNFLINKDILYANTYKVTNADPILKAGKTYAWRVRANDLGVSTAIKNDGYSTIGVFDYTLLKNEEKLPLAPVITSPKFAEVVAQLNDFSQPKINITWDKSNAPYAPTYEVKIVKLIPGFDAISALDNNVQVMLSYKQMLNSFTLESPKANEDLIYARNHGRIKLEEDATYAIQVIAGGNNPDGKLMRIENFGRSNIIEFTYKGAPKPVAAAPPAPISSTIAGKLFYRFKGETEIPIKKALNFPPITSMSQVDPKGGVNAFGAPKMISVDKYDNNNFPSYFENNTFPIGINIHPLKSVKLNFVYVVLQSPTKNPKNLNDLKPYLGYSTDMYPLTLNGEKISGIRNIGTTTLKEDGSFSYTFINNYKVGYIGTGKVPGASKDYSYFGAIRMIVGRYHAPGDVGELSDERYFTSPDVYVMPQVGKTVTIPDEIVFVKSYNYTAQVVSDKTANQAVTTGKPLSNYPVEMLDQHTFFTPPPDGAWWGPTSHSDLEDNKATMPWEADAESYANQTTKAKDEKSNAIDLPLVAIVKTDADGFARFKNLLITHGHLPHVPFNPFDGNLNYQSQNGELLKGGSVGDLYAKFNSDFIVETKIAAKPIVLKPKLPEIYLRAITVQNGATQAVPYASVHIQGYTNDQKKTLVEDEYFKTDANGYLQVKDLKENRLRTIEISKLGFANKVVATLQNIALGERFPSTVEQVMVGSGAVYGTVVNEKGQPIMANVKVGNGPYIKTYSGGVFYIERTQSGYQALTIAPVVDNYFGESLYPNIKENDITMITNNLGKANGTIVLKEKLHRVIFKVVDADSGQPISSYVGVGNNTYEYFNSDPYTGLTKEFAMASPGNEFKVRVVANGFVTYEDYKSIPVNKGGVQPIIIQLKKAQVISGVVKDAATGAPIAGARVYTVSGTNADGEVQNSTTTGIDGKYTLYGSTSPKFWFSYGQYYADLPIKIYAVKSGTPGYVRSELEASPSNPIANFSLTALSAKAEIWGLPIEVHSLVKQSYATSLITGAFIKLPSNNGFKMELSETKLPFAQLAVQTSKNGFSPAVKAINVEATSLKVMAYEKYACELIASDQENIFNKLSIKLDGSYGVLEGFLTSELSSFNFSYKYTGKFLIGSSYRLGGSAALVNNPTKVFSAKPDFAAESRYGLQALYGKDSFSVHNFTAKLGNGSKFNADGYHMNANVLLNIPLLDAKTMPAGSFTVTQNNIEWKQYDGNINMPLEKWAILGTGLSYDINQGGFKVLNGTLKTSLPQVTLKDLIIMPASVDLGISKLTGKEALTLANITPLKLAADAKMTLNYDPAAPFDQKPHYRLNLTSSDETVAYIDDLPGMGNSRVNINMLTDYSDGKHKTIIVAPTKIKYYNVLSQDVTGIDVADDFFTLVGNTNLEIPGAPANVTGRFKYTKNPLSQFADKNGNVLTVDKLQTDVEMEGKVKFEGTSFQLSQDNLAVEGRVLIYKNGPEDAIKGIRGTLTKTPGDIKMNFLPKQNIAMGNKNMEIQSGGNFVSNNKWTLVNFIGKPTNFVNKQGKNLFAQGGDLIDFEVNGAIKNKDGGKGLQLDGISTPFGDLDIVFDFDKASFSGTLNLVNANLPIGPVTINDANINLQIDKNGFLVVGIVTDASVTALPSCIAGGFKSGIALGYYTSAFPTYLGQKLLGVTLNSQLPTALNNGLKGFYVNVMKSLDKNDLPQLPGPSLKDIPLVGSFVPVFDFSAGVDINFILDLDGSKTVSIGGMVYANVSCLYDLELCTIGLSGGAEGHIYLTYGPGGLGGSLFFGIKANISYCLGQEGVNPKLELKKDGNGFSFHPSL